jgi:hypothetical protein
MMQILFAAAERPIAASSEIELAQSFFPKDPLRSTAA